MVDKVRVAFVGLGGWSEYLAEAAKKSGRMEIAACHSRTDAKMATFTKKYGGVPKRSYEDLLRDPGIDAVVLTTPNSLHASQTIEAAGMKKHIFVEKPMALSVRDCRNMITAAKEAGVILAVGHKERRTARVRLAKEFIDKGAIGEIILAEANHSDAHGMKLTPEMWKWYRKETPGGPLCNQTVHLADNLHYLVGPIKRVSAFIGKVCGKAETDDVISATVEFENGALGYLGGSFLTPIRKFVQIHGIEGVFLVDMEGGAAYYQKAGTKRLVKQPLPDEDTQRKQSCEEEIDEFAACILEGGEPETGGEEGLAAWAVMEAIIRSAESGCAVEIKDLLC
jgi:predicted dehydrogenase